MTLLASASPFLSINCFNKAGPPKALITVLGYACTQSGNEEISCFSEESNESSSFFCSFKFSISFIFSNLYLHINLIC